MTPLYDKPAPVHEHRSSMQPLGARITLLWRQLAKGETDEIRASAYHQLRSLGLDPLRGPQ